MDLYKQLIKDLYSKIGDVGTYGADTEDDLAELFKNESDIANILISSKKGLDIYRQFAEYIKKDLRDIRVSKIYFREREVTAKSLYRAIEDYDAKALSKFRINYKFLKWMLGKDIPQRLRIQKKYEKILSLREKIIQDNLALVMNRARIFQVKAKKNNLDHLDLIQIATDGFMVALDKFTPPDYFRFKSVAIGWMTNKMTDASNSGTVKLTSQDKRVLYRANLAIYKNDIKDFDKILAFVRVTYPKVTRDHLAAIIASSGKIYSIDDSDSDSVMYSSRTSKDNPERDCIDNKKLNELSNQINNLEICESKVIILKYGYSP